MEVARILGVPFTTKSFDETLAYLCARIEARQLTHVVTANPEIVMAAKRSEVFRQMLERAFVVPDGIGIIYAAKWLNLPLAERIPGIELLEALMRKANEKQWKVYLLGASPEVNEKAAERLAAQYPQARIVGRRDGYFRREDEADIVREMAALSPDLVFVAMGAPRQDEWIATHQQTLGVPVMMGVGGSLDVIAGKVKRAPQLWQRLHLEWLYRLLSQPSRWKRQLDIPRFVVTVLWDKYSRR